MSLSPLAALLPPALLPMLALLLLVRPSRLARGLSLLAVLGLIVLAWPLAASVLSRPLAREGVPGPAAPQAIVVLPSREVLFAGASDLASEGDLLLRLRVAAAAHRRSGLPILVAAASAGEAAHMADVLSTGFGTAARWQSEDGGNPWRGARRAAATLHDAGIDSIYLVGEPWEFRFAARLFRRETLQLRFLPVRRMQPAEPIWSDAIGRPADWLQSYWAGLQWAALACDAIGPCRRAFATPEPTAPDSQRGPAPG